LTRFQVEVGSDSSGRVTPRSTYDSLRLASRLKPVSRSFYGGGVRVSYGGLRRLTADWRIIYSVSPKQEAQLLLGDRASSATRKHAKKLPRIAEMDVEMTT